MLSYATKFISEQIKGKFNPKIAIILGSGLGELADKIENAVKIRYHEIPGFKQSSVDGHVGQLVIGKLENKDVLIMQGRIHYYEGYSIQDIVFPIKVMKILGIEKIILTNAAGCTNIDFQIGSFMLITDHINFMNTNPLIGVNDKTLGVRFPDMSEVYDQNLIELAQKTAEKLGITINKGIYLATCGPSFETPSEVKMFKMLGADAVGMSTVPEAITANYCGIKVLGISCLTNLAAGLSDEKLSHQDVMNNSDKSKKDFQNLISNIVKNL